MKNTNILPFKGLRILGLLFCLSVKADALPIVTTLSAIQSSLTSASANGVVNPNARDTMVYFQYGLDTNYGSTSAATVCPGIATALQFNGINQNGTVAGFGNIAPTNEITIEFWENAFALGDNAPCFLNPEYPTNRIAVSLPWGDGGTYWDFGDITSSGRLVYYPTAPLVENWQHYAVVASQSGNYMRIYRNGNLEAQMTGMRPFVRYAADMLLAGGTVNNYYFNGDLCEFRIWNAALDQTTIQTWMSSSLNPSHPYYSHLAGYWPMNDGSGSVAADDSGNGNNATLNNSPVWTKGPVLTNYQVNLSLTNISGGNVLYHYRIVASNVDGITVGGDMTFKTGAFGLVPTSMPGVGSSSVAWGDFDNDGRLDIVLTGGTTGGEFLAQVWRNLGNGSFSNLNVPLTPVVSGSVTVGDFNNDGLLDFLVTGSLDGNQFADYAQIWQNLGNGTFSNYSGNLPAVAISSAAVGDFDNDGRQDIVLMGFYGNLEAPITEVWRNTGGGNFNKVAELTGLSSGSVAVADFDNDGYEDILITGINEFGSPVTQLWRNLGNDTFSNVATGLPNLGYSSASVADFDGDGLPDLLMTGYDANGVLESRIWRNLGNGQFTNLNVALPGLDFGATATGDFNNDGLPDFILAGSESIYLGGSFVTQLYQNQGTDLFANTNALFPAIQYGSAAWGDAENDGRLDLLLTGLGGSYGETAETFLIKNYCAVTNTPPTAPTGLTTISTLTNTILMWNAATDAQTPATGLSYNVRIGSQPGGFDIVSPEADLATGQRRVPAMGNAGERLFSIYNLPPGKYYWSVQSIDSAYAGSPFSPEAKFLVGAPLVTTGNATLVASNSAVLNGTLIPNTANAGGWFEWGTTTNFGNVTTTENLSPGSNVLGLGLLAAPLQPLTTYYYRIVGSNAYGTVYGESKSFTTLASTPVAPPSFNRVTGQTGGGLLLGFQGQSNVSYTILASTNLMQWSAFTNIAVGSDGTAQIADTTTNFPTRYYRLRYP